MRVKKNPKTGALPFKSGDVFTQADPPNRSGFAVTDPLTEEVRAYRYVGESPNHSGQHSLSKVTGGGFHDHALTVSQEDLLTLFKVKPQALIKSRMSVDLSSYILRRIKLHKVDGCDASGVLLGIITRKIKVGPLEVILPVSFRMESIGMIPLKNVVEIEALDGQ